MLADVLDALALVGLGGIERADSRGGFADLRLVTPVMVTWRPSFSTVTFRPSGTTNTFGEAKPSESASSLPFKTALKPVPSMESCFL